MQCKLPQTVVRFFKTFFLIAGFVLAAVASAQAQTLPAGSQIESTASASYYNDRLGYVEVMVSNTVEAVMDEVPAVEVIGNSDLLLSRGVFGEHHFQIVNTGNVDLAISPVLASDAEGDLLESGDLYHDANANGRVDAGEAIVAPGDTMVLGIDETAYFIYAFNVDVAAEIDDFALTTLDVNAVSMWSGAAATVTGTGQGTVIISDKALQLRKSVERRTTDEGEELTYYLELRNNGESDAQPYSEIDGEPLLVDGLSRAGTLVRDTLPLNTVFLKVGVTGRNIPLYHLAGQPRHSYVSALPDNTNDIDAVAFLAEGVYPVSRTDTIEFKVLVPASLGAVTVPNVAETYILMDEGLYTVKSNEVVYKRGSAQPQTMNFIDPSSRAATQYGTLGTDVQIVLANGACNISSGVDSVQIEVISELTGDVEVVTARETGPNTAEFATPGLPVTTMSSTVPYDGVIASAEGDTLTATGICAGQPVSTELMISPGVFVFNSITDAAVPKAVVQVINARGEVVAEATTNSRGFAAPGDLVAGTYSFVVLPPDDFTFPSVRTAFNGLRTVTTGSFGGAFSHPGGAVRMIDLPVDPYYGVAVTLEKATDKQRINSGEFVTYTLTAGNRMEQALVSAEVIDRFPTHATLVPGTVTVDGESAPDPLRDGDGDHRFRVGDIAPLETRILSYVLRFTPQATSGRKVNDAILTGSQAGTGTTIVSAVARATVKLDTTGGVFSRHATVLGTVYMDCNANGRRDEEELGVPGVRIVTQEGLAVVTDGEGRYSLFGLRPVSHVFALQRATLPQGTAPRLTRVTEMGRPGSRLIALKRGELRSEDFPLENCGAPQIAEIETRRAAFTAPERDANLQGDLPIDGGRAAVRSVRNEAGLATTTQIYGVGAAEADPTAAVPAGAAPAPELPDLTTKALAAETKREPLEAIIKSLSNKAGFMDIEDGAHSLRRNITLRVKGPADLTLQLIVNGKKIAASRIGERTVWERGNVQAIEYVAIGLTTGENRLRLVGIGPFGNERASAEVTVTAPGEPSRLEIVAPGRAPAIPGTSVPVIVRIVDRQGNPVQASGIVTLDAGQARWDVTDIRDDQPGVQAFIDNGEANFGLLAPQASGSQRLTVSGAFGRASAQILFTPDLDQRVLVGIIEGAIGLEGRYEEIGEGVLSPFEDTATGLRGEIYLKGRIRGDRLLTLRYSSDRDTEDRLFRDIQSDEYYPVYGDNSERGFDAQSSTNLFVKVEKGASYMLYGDISIEPGDPAFRLGGYRNLTTGAKAHWENEKVGLTVFAARTSQQNRQVEFPGRGISGPYDIDLTDFRDGSDQVDVIVRDKVTGEILSETRLRRLSDYVLDYFRNTIVFDSPLRQFDEDGNPVSARFAYQVDGEGGARYWYYGGEALFTLTDKTSAGVRVIRSAGDAGTPEDHDLVAGFIKTQLGKDGDKGELELEIAQASNGDGSSGNAARLSYTRRGEDASFTLEAAIAEDGFAPTGSSVRPGTRSLGADYEIKLNDRTDLRLGADYVADTVAGTERVSLEGSIRRELSDVLDGTLGLRVEEDLKSDETSAELLVGAVWRPRDQPNVQHKLDVSIPVAGDADTTLTFGSEYAMENGIKMFVRTELGFKNTDDFAATDRTRFGVEYRIAEWLTGRTEFSEEGGAARERRLVQGLTSSVDLSDRLSVRMSLEHSEAVEGEGGRTTSLAVGGKWESRSGDWIADADLDQTFEEDGRTLYANIGVGGRISPELSLLARSRLSLDKRGEGADRLRHRMRVGAAYRAIEDDRFNALAWYEHRYDRQEQLDEQHLWSVAGTWRAGDRLRINAKYAGQYSRFDTGAGTRVSGLMQMVQAGANFDFVPNRFEAGVNAYHIWDNEGYSDTALGLEGGIVAAKGTLLSVGYNMSRGKVPGEFVHYRDGLYMRLRLKLDESLWDQLDRLWGD